MITIVFRIENEQVRKHTEWRKEIFKKINEQTKLHTHVRIIWIILLKF